MGRQEEPLAVVNAYNNMKKAPEETVQEFSTCFMKVYTSIPVEFRPPPGVVQLRYVDSFDNDFTLLLRERRTTNLDTIMRNTIEVEVNMMVSRKIKHRFNRGDKRPQGDVQPSTSRFIDDKFNLMMRTMEKIMEKMSVGNRLTTWEQQDPQPRNQNLRRGQVPHTI